MNIGYLQLLEYHNLTKHMPNRYAPSPGYLDWATQPNPYRFYTDAEKLELALLDRDLGQPYSALYSTVQARAISLDSIAVLLELSMGLSAWKQYQGNSWSLRMNPSSGNLHPTECNLLVPAMGQAAASVSHYNPLLHCLEVRAELPEVSDREMPPGFGLILSSIYWREAWKYGERAFRYVNHDVGHALAALRYAANLLGWKMRLCPQVESEILNSVLGFEQFDLPGIEKEEADCLVWFSNDQIDLQTVVDWVSELEPPAYVHEPNQLSDDHREWPEIPRVAELVKSPGFMTDPVESRNPLQTGDSVYSAEEIIRKRRSAQVYNLEKSWVTKKDFFQMLAATLPAACCPFDAINMEPSVSLFIFVHQVEGLNPGLYCLVRGQAHLDNLKDLLKDGFSWEQVDTDLPLYMLEVGDYRATAEMISCQQAIAGDSAFSLSMLSRFRPVLENSPWRYPSLYWETGMIGQVLYLESEANGLQGTGIGCFYDDLMHELLGMTNDSWQDLYHFTVGVAEQDTRIQTLAPYFHLESMRSQLNNQNPGS